jgi:DHA3 family macrolide efflux protein-like MFS transporter
VSVNDRIPANVFLNRNFLLLWAAYGIAAIGDNMNDTGQLALVNALETEKSVRLMALMMFGLMLPFLILGPVAGWAADRISRQLTMISADVIRGVIVLNFATIIPWLLGIGFGDYTVMSTQIMLGMLGAFFSPARQAMLPTLVRHDQLVTANGMIGAIAPIGAVIGFLIGGIIVDQAGPVWNFRINAVTFLSSATLIAFIIVPRGVHQVGAAGESMLAPLLEGFAYVRSHRRVLSLIAILSVFWGAAGVVYACVPAIVTKLVSDKYTDVGTYRALTAMGMIPGAVLMSLLGKHLGIKVPLVGGLLFAGLWLIVLALTFWIELGATLAAICLVGVGLAGAMLLITTNASVQRFVPNTRRGRVFGISDMMTMGAMVSATGFLGLPNWEQLDRYVPLILLVTAGVMLIAGGLALSSYRRNDPYGLRLSLSWWVVEVYARFWCKLKRVGHCTLPREGPVILAANHTSGVDSLAIYASQRVRQLRFLVADKYYNQTVANWFMRLAGCIPISLTNPRKQAVTDAIEALKAGDCVAIFPQGTYVEIEETDPPAKPGIGLIALRSRATVIPCHISGTTYHFNPFRSLWLRHDVRVKYGQPLKFERQAGPIAPQARAVAEEIMAAIRKLAPDPESD